jgi:hypothetical protein
MFKIGSKVRCIKYCSKSFPDGTFGPGLTIGNVYIVLSPDEHKKAYGFSSSDNSTCVLDDFSTVHAWMSDRFESVQETIDWFELNRSVI